MTDSEERSGGLGKVLFKYLQKYSNNIIQYLDEINKANTYSDLLTRSIRTAIKLQEHGIGQNDIISSCTHNHENSCVPFLASQFIGAISANFDPRISHLDTVYLLKLIQPKILFVCEESLDFMEKCVLKANVQTEIVVFGSSEKYTQFSEFLESCKGEKEFQPIEINNYELTAVILFSSGTTGLPKGICLHHKCLINIGKTDEIKFSLKAKRTVLLYFSTLYWISATYSLIRCICNGFSYVVQKQFDPAHTWTLIEKYKATSLFLPPYDATSLLSQRIRNVDVSSLEIFLTGACPVTKKLMQDLRRALPQAKILNSYGSSETAGSTTVFDVADEEQYKMQILKPLSCGKVKSGFEAKIVNVNTEEDLGPNQKGEIRIKGENLMNGYYYIDSSSAFDSNGYFKTGDLGYFDEDDCLFVVGRIKEIFKYRGWHILPEIIEEVLKSHSAVEEAAVIGIPHEVDGSHPMGVVTLVKGCDHVKPEDIENFVNKNVSENQKLRAGVSIVDSIPKTTTGKIKRMALQDMFVKNINVQYTLPLF